MQTLLFAYIVIYSAVFIVAFAIHWFVLPAEEKQDTTRFEDLVDLALFSVGLVGMLFLFTKYDQASVKLSWKFVSLFLAVAQIGLNVRGRARHLREHGDDGSAFVRVADIGMLLFLMPSLGLNIAYAYSE